MRYFNINDPDCIEKVHKDFLNMYFIEKLKVNEIRERLGDSWWKNTKYTSISSANPIYLREKCNNCGGNLKIEMHSGSSIDRLQVYCEICHHDNTNNCTCRACYDERELKRITEFNSKYDSIVKHSTTVDTLSVYEETLIKLYMQIGIELDEVDFNMLGLELKSPLIEDNLLSYISRLVSSGIIYPTKNSAEHITLKESSYSYNPYYCKYKFNIPAELIEEISNKDLDFTAVSIFYNAILSKLLTDYTISLGEKYKLIFDDKIELNRIIYEYVSSKYILMGDCDNMTIGNWIQCLYYTIKSMVFKKARVCRTPDISEFIEFLEVKLKSIPIKDNYGLPYNIKPSIFLINIIRNVYKFTGSIEEFSISEEDLSNNKDIKAIYEDSFEEWEKELNLIMESLEEGTEAKMSKDDLLELLDIPEVVLYILRGVSVGLTDFTDGGDKNIMDIVYTWRKSKKE